MSLSPNTNPHAPSPGPERKDWVDFLKWLASDMVYDSNEIVRVVEEPWHYVSEYGVYLDRGGLDR